MNLEAFFNFPEVPSMYVMEGLVQTCSRTVSCGSGYGRSSKSPLTRAATKITQKRTVYTTYDFVAPKKYVNASLACTRGSMRGVKRLLALVTEQGCIQERTTHAQSSISPSKP